jgi:hypothetical protein
MIEPEPGSPSLSTNTIGLSVALSIFIYGQVNNVKNQYYIAQQKPVHFSFDQFANKRQRIVDNTMHLRNTSQTIAILNLTNVFRNSNRYFFL